MSKHITTNTNIVDQVDSPLDLPLEHRDRTFVEAFIDRYDTIEDDLIHARNQNIHFVLQENSPQRMADGRISASFSLSLDDYRICELGSLEYIKETCKRVTTLTLQRNKIKDWKIVFQLLDCMPYLRQMDLTGNQLGSKIDDTEYDLYTWRPLSYLCLNSMNLKTFKPIQSVLQRLPNVTELSLSMNGIQEIDVSDTFQHKKLEVLNLCDNLVQSGEQVRKLGRAFPNMKELILANNPISRIDQMAIGMCQNIFTQLKKISFNNTNVDDWESIVVLKNFPKLKSVCFRGVPLATRLKSGILTSVIAIYLGEGITVNGCRMGAKDITYHQNQLRDYFEDQRFSDRKEACPLLDKLDY
ncbi:hypothetical protein ACOME3_003484 [Neoechinorhynchus agilis]